MAARARGQARARTDERKRGLTVATPATMPAEANRPEMIHQARTALSRAADLLACAAAAERAAGTDPTLVGMARLAGCDAQALGRRWSGIVARIEAMP